MASSAGRLRGRIVVMSSTGCLACCLFGGTFWRDVQQDLRRASTSASACCLSGDLRGIGVSFCLFECIVCIMLG